MHSSTLFTSREKRENDTIFQSKKFEITAHPAILASEIVSLKVGVGHKNVPNP